MIKPSATIALPVALVAVVLAAPLRAEDPHKTLLRIDACDLDDRGYMQSGFYPAAPVERWTDECATTDCIKTFGSYEGALVELPMLPGHDHRIRAKIRPSGDCEMRFFIGDSGLPREYYHRLAGTAASPLAKSVKLAQDEPIEVEFPLSEQDVAGREQVMLFYRAVKPDMPGEKAGLDLLTYWIEVQVKGGDELAPLIRTRRAIEEARFGKERVSLRADSVVKTGEPFRLFVTVNRPSGFPDASFRGTLSLISNSTDLKVPEWITFTETDGGVKRVEGLKCTEEGDYFVRAWEGKAALQTWRSNYILCRKEPEYRVYWGDLHVHTNVSDGNYSPEAAYELARDVAKLDFISLNDHDTWLSREKWDRQKDTAKRHNLPGRFVTILGTEWTSAIPPTPRGHHNVWFEGDDAPTFENRDRKTHFSQPVAALWEQVKPFGAMMCTHHLHPANDYSDWTFEREPVVEIYSCWGSSERSGIPEQTTILYNGETHPSPKPNNSAVNLLDRGMKLGIIANSDSHVGAPGLNVPHSYRVGVTPYRRPGITAILAPELTRAAVFDAIRHRRCYGTMNERILVDFSINGHSMGEEFSLRSPKVDVKMQVWGTAPIASIALVRNGEVVYCPVRYGERDHGTWSFTDRQVPQGTSYYYVRVQQLMAGEYVNAWSSPIWVTNPVPPEESGETTASVAAAQGH